MLVLLLLNKREKRYDSIFELDLYYFYFWMKGEQGETPFESWMKIRQKDFSPKFSFRFKKNKTN